MATTTEDSNDVVGKIHDDLEKSGLALGDIHGRPATESEWAAIGLAGVRAQGYVIPYYDFKGKPVKFYRVKRLNPPPDYPKYMQPPGKGCQVYYPPPNLRNEGKGGSFSDMVFKGAIDDTPYVIITEGEKKAACATKNGFPCIALGGVDNWRHKTIQLPKDTELTKSPEGKILARVPSGWAQPEERYLMLAHGMSDLFDFLIENPSVQVVICYDTDRRDGCRMEVQRAAARLAYEMVHRGIESNRIRQAILPCALGPDPKRGLDDYIQQEGAAELTKLIREVFERSNCFPRHPMPKEFIKRNLLGKLNRKSYEQLGLAILAELDGRGVRLRDPEAKQLYYFDDASKSLMGVDLGSNSEPLHETAFGEHLHRMFSLTEADNKLLKWVAALYTGSGHIESVNPQRIVAPIPSKTTGRYRDPTKSPGIMYQLGDGHALKITEEGPEIVTNGRGGVLFERGHSEEPDFDKLQKELNKVKGNIDKKKPYHGYLWRHALDSLNFESEDQRKSAELLFYAAPWLNRWRGIQFPVEIVTGEAGSGKSSLYSLRLRILTGRSDLRPIPKDLRDWYSSITSTGGLHVIDNAQISDRSLRQKLSDEMCRIVTEPYPHVEMRRLYTTASLMRVSVNVSFAITAIALPLHNDDLLQRSVLFNLNALESEHETAWDLQQIEGGGGREAWIAHHADVLWRFLIKAKKEWTTKFTSMHRLAHYEQTISMIARVLNMEFDPSILRKASDEAIASDWVVEGLQAFKEYWPDNNSFSTIDVAEWAQAEPAYQGNDVLTTTRRLGHYIGSHKAMLERMLGIVELRKTAHGKVYAFRGKAELDDE